MVLGNSGGPFSEFTGWSVPFGYFWSPLSILRNSRCRTTWPPSPFYERDHNFRHNSTCLTRFQCLWQDVL